MCACVYVHAHVCTCTHALTCAHTCVHAERSSVCARICVCACVCMSVHAHTCVCTGGHVYVHMHMQVLAPAYVHAHIHMCLCKCARAHAHAQGGQHLLPTPNQPACRLVGGGKGVAHPAHVHVCAHVCTSGARSRNIVHNNVHDLSNAWQAVGQPHTGTHSSSASLSECVTVCGCSLLAISIWRSCALLHTIFRSLKRVICKLLLEMAWCSRSLLLGIMCISIQKLHITIVNMQIAHHEPPSCLQLGGFMLGNLLCSLAGQPFASCCNKQTLRPFAQAISRYWSKAPVHRLLLVQIGQGSCLATTLQMLGPHCWSSGQCHKGCSWAQLAEP